MSERNWAKIPINQIDAHLGQIVQARLGPSVIEGKLVIIKDGMARINPSHHGAPVSVWVGATHATNWTLYSPEPTRREFWDALPIGATFRFTWPEIPPFEKGNPYYVKVNHTRYWSSETNESHHPAGLDSSSNCGMERVLV